MKISNLKVFDFNSKKKYVLKRVTSFVMAIVTVATMQACKILDKNDTIKDPNDYVITEYDDDYNTETKVEYEYDTDNDYNSSYESVNDLSSVDYEEEPKQENKVISDDIYSNVINSNVSIDNNERTYFKDYLESIDVVYPYSELYGINESLNNYNSVNKNTSFENKLIKNNFVDYNELYNIVTENNKTLISQRQPVNLDVKDICKTLCEIINDYLMNNENVDYALLSEKLSTLRIEQSSSFAYGYYSLKNNCIGINYQFDKSRIQNIIQHEIYHFLQAGPSAFNGEESVEVQFGFCYKFKNDTINALNLTWFYEGSAEYLMMDYNNTHESTLYKGVINSMQTIKTATILDPKNNTNSFEKLSLSENIEDLYKYFNCESDKDKQEILNMMYANELLIDLNIESSSVAFYKLYRQELNKYDLEFPLVDSICQTLTKTFYSNLINYSGNSIEDIFSLISIFETELNCFSWFKGNMDKYQKFISVYNDIQNNYFQILANKLNIDVETLLNIYAKYYDQVEVDAYKINNLNADKKEFYDYIVETRQRYKRGSIYSLSKSLGGISK